VILADFNDWCVPVMPALVCATIFMAETPGISDPRLGAVCGLAGSLTPF